MAVPYGNNPTLTLRIAHAKDAGLLSEMGYTSYLHHIMGKSI